MDDVRVRYRNFTLGPVNTTFPRGVTCVVGVNGAGKSTFFRVLAGIEKSRSGSVRLAGSSRAPHQVGLLPQDVDFPGRATCAEYLTHVAWLFAVPRTHRADAVADALSAVGLSDRAGSRISTLSGGMRRRLGLAHVLVHSPDLLLLDEPTAGLDPLQRVAIRDTIGAIAAQRTVVVSTHLVEDVAALADRVLVLREGSVRYDGTVDELAAHDAPDAPGATALERAITAALSTPAAGAAA
ncbi:ABC transporter ATP-binding protein [Isoptericola sp. NPDC057191]|uniref:ABC transporter ATP-binding protein n=1 Tax=Isoptericola sp. NPDC057191 TaxID=3346041 RepID=UPI00362F7918